MSMTKKEFLDYVEDKIAEISDEYFFHATHDDIHTVEQILNEGIKCAYLREEQSNQGYNGKYYVSVSKKTDNPECVYKLYEHLPIFVLGDIDPIKADKKNKIFTPFKETALPFRTSNKSDEYHVLHQIEPSKIIALGYSLYHMLSDGYKFDIYKLQFVKELILLLEKTNMNLPIYDLTSSREINKDKVKSLKLEEISKRIL